MTTYFDSSALVAVYVTQDSSARARRRARVAGGVPYTLVHDLETRNALRLLHGRSMLAASELRQLSAQLDEDLAEGRLVRIAVDLPHAFERAREFSDLHSAKLLCRSLDVLHVALALEIGCSIFVSGDNRQLALARAVRLTAVDVKQRRRQT